MKVFTTNSQDKGKKLIDFLKEKLGSAYSVRKIKSFIDQNLCLLGGRVERFSCTKLNVGQRVSLSIPKAKKLFFGTLIFQNDDFLVWDKPAGLCSCGKKSLEEHLKKKFSFVSAVHRLDRNTTGLILFALQPEAKKDLEQLFFERKIKKTYLALVEGLLFKEKGCIQSYLGKKKIQGGQVIYQSGGSLFAQTDWIKRKSFKTTSLLSCFPKTGRTHQIRVHLKEMGHVIVGDYLYGAKQYHATRPLLHAQSLNFSFRAKNYEFHAPTPEDFSKVLKTRF